MNTANKEWEEATNPGRVPFLARHQEAKAHHPEVVILVRRGDYFEAWGQDAATVAETLAPFYREKANCPEWQYCWARWRSGRRSR